MELPLSFASSLSVGVALAVGVDLQENDALTKKSKSQDGDPRHVLLAIPIVHIVSRTAHQL